MRRPVVRHYLKRESQNRSLLELSYGFRRYDQSWLLGAIGERIMQFANECRERALALLTNDPKSSQNSTAYTWLRLAYLEDQIVLWAAHIERESDTN
jgi:hypothetical protein